jgi:hypothetical protein
MSFFKKLFSKKTKPTTQKASTPELDIEEFKKSKTIDVEGKYKVHSFLSYAPTCDNEKLITCKSFLTEGMTSVGQQELILTIVLPENTEEWKYLTLPYVKGLFHVIYTYAEKGTIVSDGDFTSFSEGSNVLTFTGVIYANHPEKVSDRVPDDCLSITLIRDREKIITIEMGYMRMLTMLGRQVLRYPFPIWNDMRRPEAELVEGVLEKTMMRHNFAKVRDGYVHSENNTVYFQLSKSSVGKYKTFWTNPIVLENPLLGVYPSFNHEIKLCKTWSANPSYINLLSGHKGNQLDDARISGCLLVLIGEQEEPAVLEQEDGFGIEMTKELWGSFIEAIHSQQNFGFDVEGTKPSDLIGFRLEWID